MVFISRLAKVAAALLVAALASQAAASAGHIRWIADDWPRALAEARKRDALVVVDTWAPW
jgi:glycerol kinase